MRRSYIPEAYCAGLATALAAVIYGYQFTGFAIFLARLCRFWFL